MFDQQELLRQSQLAGLKSQESDFQQPGIFADAMRNQELRNSELQSSKFKFWGIEHKDSASMTEVKTAMANLNTFMEGTIPQSDDEFQNGLNSLKEIYRILISKCQTYVDTHSRPFTASGKARLRMVRATMNLARRETELLEGKAKELYDTKETDLVWGNLLGAIRGAEFDLDHVDNVEQDGAGTSEVTIITTNSKKVFFKEDEELRPPSEEIQRRYIDGCTDETDRQIYTELQRLMTDDMGISAVAMNNKERRDKILSEDCETSMEGFDELIQCLEELDVSHQLDFHNPRVQQITKELLPRYTKWLTRFFLCSMGQIDKGSVLSMRNVATSRLAYLLDMPDIVAASNVATVKRKGSEDVCRGIAMAEAKGEKLEEVLKNARDNQQEVTYSPEAIRQLARLQMFDVLCCQIDRNVSNRFVTYEVVGKNVLITGVQGIDNDIAFGKMSYQELNRTPTGVNMLPVFEVDNMCTIPALDAKMVTNLSALEDELVIHAMSDLLSEKEIEALLDRIKGVKKTIESSMEKNPGLVVNPDEWTEEVIERFTQRQVNKAYADMRLYKQ